MASLLQIVDVEITASRNSAIDSIPSEQLIIPAVFPINMLVILRPGREASVNEKFWLGILYI